MKRLHLLTITLMFLFNSCTVIKDVTTISRQASYFVSLDKVELPSNSKERFSETIQKNKSDKGVTKFMFEDENIRIFWIVLDEQFSFTFYNKTNHALKINWDDVVYVNTDNSISKMIHSGIKYSKMNEGQVSATIPRGAKLEDILVPVDNIHLIANEWTTQPLFPNKFSTDAEMEKAKALEGESVRILLPIRIEDVQNDYTFYFKINQVETNIQKNTHQVHDFAEELSMTTSAIVGGIIVLIAVVAIVLAAK